MILDYFGDLSQISQCVCDICAPGAGAESMPTETSVVVSDEVTTLVRQLLSAIARLKGQFGVGVIADVLVGAENERTLKWRLEQLSVHGLLREHTAKRVVAMLHRLMEAGLARQRDPDGIKFRPVVELTAAGIAVMKGEQPPPASLMDLRPSRQGSRANGTNPRALGTNPRAMRQSERSVDVDADVQLDSETLERFERLRVARSELASDRQLPPYCICHDSTLKLIARSAPDTLASLEQIKGMGPHKIKMYGQRFLDAVTAV